MGDSRVPRSPNSLPASLAILLEAGDPADRERAWSAFLDEYSRLILHTARSLGSEYDKVMDRYAYILERLREDNCHRLRAYAAEGGGSFTTWLTVVVRRLCLDHYRRVYGRPRGDAEGRTEEERNSRARLADLVGVEVEVERIGGSLEGNPEAVLRIAELEAALKNAVAELPATDRVLLALRFEDERSMKEITRLMGFSSRFQAHRRLKSVLEALRASLNFRGIRGPTA